MKTTRLFALAFVFVLLGLAVINRPMGVSASELPTPVPQPTEITQEELEQGGNVDTTGMVEPGILDEAEEGELIFKTQASVEDSLPWVYGGLGAMTLLTLAFFQFKKSKLSIK